MWIKSFILSILMLVASRVDACDACGCGPGAAFLQAMPQFGRRSVDFSASLRGGRSEFLPFAALRYQHAVGDRSALWVQVPVSAAYYRGYWSDGTFAEHLLGGLGDPNVGAMHRWILPQGQLQAGAWLGIPLGAYRLRSIQGTLHPSGYQPGNGAFSGGIWTNLWLGSTERAWLLSGQASASAVNRYGVARPASASLQALRMRGRETEHSATRLAAAARGERGQVLVDRQVGEHLPALGHHRQAHARDAVRGQAAHLGAVEGDPSGARGHQAQDRAHQRRLAHAVAPEQTDHLAGAHLEVDAEQHLARAVRGLEPLDRKQRRGAHRCTSSPR